MPLISNEIEHEKSNLTLLTMQPVMLHGSMSSEDATVAGRVYRGNTLKYVVILSGQSLFNC